MSKPYQEQPFKIVSTRSIGDSSISHVELSDSVRSTLRMARVQAYLCSRQLRRLRDASDISYTSRDMELLTKLALEIHALRADLRVIYGSELKVSLTE